MTGNDQRSCAFMDGFFREENASIGRRIANGMVAVAGNMPLRLPEDGLLCAAMMREQAAGFVFGDGIFLREERVPREEAEKLRPYLTGALIHGSLTDMEQQATEEKLCWGGGRGGHSDPDFSMLMKLGTEGLRQRAELYATLSQENIIERSCFAL